MVQEAEWCSWCTRPPAQSILPLFYCWGFQNRFQNLTQVLCTTGTLITPKRVSERKANLPRPRLRLITL